MAMVRSLDSMKKIVQMYFCNDKLRIMLESREVAFSVVQQGFFSQLLSFYSQYFFTSSTSLDFLYLFYVNGSYIWLTYILQ